MVQVGNGSAGSMSTGAPLGTPPPTQTPDPTATPHATAPPTSLVGDPAQSSPVAQRLFAWLRARPILCLLLLTPGIPEYLSGSSPLALLLRNPVAFFLFLGLNLGLYGPGVLLIREASVRWGKGWATILTLGAAYAILEEGVALNTFYFPGATPVGSLGFYGHWLGVSWVWVTGLIMVHAVFSIGLPIVLHGLALPETRGRSLLTGRAIGAVLTILVADVIGLGILTRKIYQFDPGLPILLGSLAAIALLAYAALRFPESLLAPRAEGRSGWRGYLFVLGAVLLTGTFLLEGIFQSAHAAPVLCILALLGFYAALTYGARALYGPGMNPRGVVAFAAGALTPIMVIGVVSSIQLPVALVADAAAIGFLLHLWRKYPDRGPEVVLVPPNVATRSPFLDVGPVALPPTAVPRAQAEAQ